MKQISFSIAQIKHYSEHLNRGYHLLLHSTVLEGVPIFSYSGVLWELDCKNKNQGISFFILHSSWSKEGQEAALGQLNSAVSDQKPPSLVIQLKKSEVYFSEKMLKILFYSWSCRNKIVTFYKLF